MNFYEYVSTKQRRIAELARIHPELSLTSLAYHIDMKWLYEAYRRTRKDGVAGVDGQTAKEYARDLKGNLQSLLERAKAGSWRHSFPNRIGRPLLDAFTHSWMKGTCRSPRPIIWRKTTTC